MKKIFILILFSMLFLSSEVNAKSDSSSLIIAGDFNYPPYEYLDENGNYKGFNVDIINAISIELGIDIELKPVEWNKAFSLLENGEVDAIQGVSYSKKRDLKYDFTNSILENQQIIFVKSKNEFIKEISDLENLKVSIQKNDISSEFFDQLKNVTILEYPSQYEAVKALSEDKVDAFIGNRLTGLYFIQKKYKTKDYKIIGENISESTSYSIAVLDGNKETLEELNKGLSIIKKNGTYDKIYKKWFGENVQNIEKWKNLFFLVLIFLITIVLISLFTVYINRILKKEVIKRTLEISNKKNDIEKQNRLKGKIIENVYAGIISFDLDGNITSINQFAINILSIHLDVNDNISSIDFLKNIDFKNELIFNEKSFYENEVKIVNKQNKSLDIIYRIIPIYKENVIESYLICLFDFTKERILSKAAAENKKFKSIGLLSASIAHEIRNPLTSIVMLVDMIPSKFNDKDFLNKFMEIVPSELSRLNNLITALLDYSKCSKPIIENISFKKIVDDVLVLLKPYTDKKNISFIKNYCDAFFLVDNSQFKQILLNILLNSVDSIVVFGNIEIDNYIDNNRLFITISDDGCGISENRINKIFDPFYTSKDNGYGIGLSITYNLVQQNKGTIEIKSKKGYGTNVILSFPIS